MYIYSSHILTTKSNNKEKLYYFSDRQIILNYSGYFQFNKIQLKFVCLLKKRKKNTKNNKKINKQEKFGSKLLIEKNYIDVMQFHC